VRGVMRSCLHRGVLSAVAPRPTVDHRVANGLGAVDGVGEVRFGLGEKVQCGLAAVGRNRISRTEIPGEHGWSNGPRVESDTPANSASSFTMSAVRSVCVLATPTPMTSGPDPTTRWA
jgi:hypothetical protein